jgi:hypothetical protein
MDFYGWILLNLSGCSSYSMSFVVAVNKEPVFMGDDLMFVGNMEKRMLGLLSEPTSVSFAKKSGDDFGCRHGLEYI